MADVLSLKWVEGNDTVTLSGGTYTTPVDVHINGNTNNAPTFNVDNPTMWTPLSVLSGLASGYCERRAVLNSIFVTGTTIDGNSVVTNIEKDWYTDGSAARDEIARNFMHNLAVGSSGDANMYQSATNATMNMFGSAGTSNYMTAMDSAITALVSGVSVYVNSDGELFSLSNSPFSGLASAAHIAAAADGDPTSSIQLPSSGGGTMNSRMLTALPIEWAKERKWMLEQLRFTPTFSSPIQSAPSMGLVYSDGYSATTMQAAINYVKTHGSSINPDTDGNYATTAHNYQTFIEYQQRQHDSATISNTDVLASNLGSTGTLKCPTTTLSISSGATQVASIEAYNLVYTSTYVSEGVSNVDAIYTSQYYDTYTSLTSALALVTDTPISSSMVVSIYIGHPRGTGITVDEIWLTAYMSDDTYYVGPDDYISGNYIKHGSDGAYTQLDSSILIVSSGASVRLESGTKNAVLVESGGVLTIANPTAHVNSCCVLTGGTVTGDLQMSSGNLYFDAIDDYYSNFQVCYDLGMGDGAKLYSAAIISSGVTKSYTQSELTAISGICVSSGGTAIISNCNFQDDEGHGSMGHIRVCSGGVAVLEADQSIPTLTLDGLAGVYSRSPENDFYSSGIIYYNNNVEAWRNADNDIKYVNAAWSSLDPGWNLYDKDPDFSVLSGDGYEITSIYKPSDRDVYACQVMTGGTVSMIGADYARLTVEHLDVESFAKCNITGNCITGNTWLASGGSIICDSNVRLACEDRFNRRLTVQDGGVIHVLGATCMNDLFKFRYPTVRSPIEGIRETSVKRLDTYNLATMDITPIPLSAGWNEVQANFSIEGSTDCIIYTADLTNYNPAPVTENVYRGIDNYSWNQTADSDISIGFTVRAIKVANVADNYKNFYIRQYPTDAEIDEAEQIYEEQQSDTTNP